MVRYKTVVMLILTLWGAALVGPFSSTSVTLERHLGTGIQELLDLSAIGSSDVLLGLTADITYSTYLGGSDSEDNIRTVADSDGNIWVTGVTRSVNFPTTPDAYNRTYGGGNTDVFAIKLDGKNGSLIYSTYIGGSAYEVPQGIQIDPEGNVWICGETGSSDFPTTPFAYNSTLGGPIDMFILSLSGSNGSLLHSTYVGGSGAESAFSMDFDSEGNVWATGITDSGDFPMSPSSLYPKHNGSLDAVLFQLSKNGTTLMYSTFFGGTDADYGYGVLVDSLDDVWLAGTTDSIDFPATPNAYENTTSGGSDIYLLRLAGDGSSLIYSTYFGGSGNDYVIDLAFDSSGNIWGTGATFSTLFPTTSNAYDSSHGGSTDCVQAIQLQTHFPRHLMLSMNRIADSEMPFSSPLRRMGPTSTIRHTLADLTLSSSPLWASVLPGVYGLLVKQSPRTSQLPRTHSTEALAAPRICSSPHSLSTRHRARPSTCLQ
ncbi:MAG: SBBP repeat-containing protein [Candidatus Thorarchaeota archaeon]